MNLLLLVFRHSLMLSISPHRFDGDTQLDDLNVAGVATFSSLVDVNNRLDVVGGVFRR